MKKAVLTTAALAIGAGLVGGSAAAASAAAEGSGNSAVLARARVPDQGDSGDRAMADTVTQLASNGQIAKGSAFDKKKPGQPVSGIYLDGLDPTAAKKPTIPVKNPAYSGSVQVRPLQAPTATGLGSLLPNK